MTRQCYTHGGPYVGEPGREGCQAAYCVALRAEVSTRRGPYFHVERLKRQNEAGITASGFVREIHETAKREGREVEKA